MKLTNQQILAASEAITALDGGHVTQLVEGKAVPVWHGYTLTGAVRWLLARNQGILQTALADFHRAKDALIRQHSSGDSAITPRSPAFEKFTADFNALTQVAVELPLRPVTEGDLALETNQIPINVLHALLPVIVPPQTPQPPR